MREYLKRSQDDVDAFTERFRLVATVVESGLTLEATEEDPADDRVVGCAVAASASRFSSEDAHLRTVEKHRGIVMLSPAGFLAMMSLRWGTKSQTSSSLVVSRAGERIVRAYMQLRDPWYPRQISNLQPSGPQPQSCTGTCSDYHETAKDARALCLSLSG